MRVDFRDFESMRYIKKYSIIVITYVPSESFFFSFPSFGWGLVQLGAMLILRSSPCSFGIYCAAMRAGARVGLGKLGTFVGFGDNTSMLTILAVSIIFGHRHVIRQIKARPSILPARSNHFRS